MSRIKCSDLICLTGVGVFTAGVWLFSPAAALMCLGALLIVIGAYSYKRGA